jgi:large subunit ribosomal protein L10
LNRQEKEKQVAWLREEFQGTKAFILADYRSMTVSEINQLRVELRKHGVKFKVLKNTLARLAYKDTDVAAIAPDLASTRAGAWTPDANVAPAMAKTFLDFAKTHPNLVIVSGMVSGERITPGDLDALSKLPSREELIGRLLGTMQAPVSAFVNTLAAIPRSFLYVLKAIEDQKGPAPEEAAAE